MVTEPTEELVANSPAGDAADETKDEIRCQCGYDLRNVPETGRCPRCRRDVASVLDDLEQASLDGRVRRRLGASLLLANHLVWLCMMASWYVGIRDNLRGILTLLAAAGPRSVTSIEAFKPGTVREFATSVGLLFGLHLAGVWMLSTVRRDEPLASLRKAGRVLRCVQIAALAAAIWLVSVTDKTDRRLLVCLNLFELPVGLLLGGYIAQLGIAEGSRLLTIGGRIVSILLALSAAVLAAFAFFGWRPGVPPLPSFYVGLFLSAAGGLLLLALLFRVRILLGRDADADSDEP